MTNGKRGGRKQSVRGIARIGIINQPLSMPFVTSARTYARPVFNRAYVDRFTHTCTRKKSSDDERQEEKKSNESEQKRRRKKARRKRHEEGRIKQKDEGTITE